MAREQPSSNAKKLGIPSVGIEANPLAHFACQVKTAWEVNVNGLLKHTARVAAAAHAELEAVGIADNPLPLFSLPRQAELRLQALPVGSYDLLLTDSISPLPLHKTLTLLDCLKRLADEHYQPYELLALAKALVDDIGNLHFGPEVGVGAKKSD